MPGLSLLNKHAYGAVRMPHDRPFSFDNVRFQETNAFSSRRDGLNGFGLKYNLTFFHDHLQMAILLAFQASRSRLKVPACH